MTECACRKALEKVAGYETYHRSMSPLVKEAVSAALANPCQHEVEFREAAAQIERSRQFMVREQRERRQTEERITQAEADLTEALEVLITARHFVNGDSPEHGIFAAIDAVLAKHRVSREEGTR